MEISKETLSQIHKIIAREQDFQEANSKNFPLTVKNEKFADSLESTSYWRFIEFADYHYFISRILYKKKVFEYSMFCGNQCIENYLKAYLIFKGVIPDPKHGLLHFLYKCREITSPKNGFIHSKQLFTIVSKYNPFEEYARYPVQHERPGDIFVFNYPNGIYMLDYFVFSMRQIIRTPEGERDIFIDGHQYLDNCRVEYPDFYIEFIDKNINFPDQFPECKVGQEYVHLRINSKEFNSDNGSGFY
jgi:hypothetical protein